MVAPKHRSPEEVGRLRLAFDTLRQWLLSRLLRDEDRQALRRDALLQAARLRQQRSLEDTRFFLVSLADQTGPDGVPETTES